MSTLFYNIFKGHDGVDWAAGVDSDFKVMLVTASYTPSASDAHPNATGLATNEITGGGYARQNVGSRTKTVNNGTNTYDHSANNVTFTNITGSPRYAVIYKVVTGDSDHILVCAIDLGAQSVTAGDFTLKWNNGSTSGIVFQGT